MTARVLVAMSGGVDSSVAAAMLVRAGYDVVGVTMKLHQDGSDVPDKPCCSLDSANDARRIAGRIGIPHYVLDMERAFERDVMHDFVAEYARGRTPIPCVRCNTFTKFHDLVLKANAIDAEFVATGHYARIVDGALHRGADDRKDQTYFLWGVPRAALARMLLPVGEMTKQETRAAARGLKLATADKPESVEICFVPDDDYAAVLEQHLPADAPALSPGPFVSTTGRVLGEHAGFARYTVGQRKGLPGGRSRPLYVLAIRPEDRAVVVGGAEELGSDQVRLEELNWLAAPLSVGDRCEIQIRYRAPSVPARVTALVPGGLSLVSDTPMRAVTPGQSGVLYSARGQVLGGGVIA